MEHSPGAATPAQACIPLAMVAHEVRNLLTPVVAQCEMALSVTNEERSRKALALTIHSVNDVVEAMQSVLDAAADGTARASEVDACEQVQRTRSLLLSEWPDAEVLVGVPRGTRFHGDGVGFRIAVWNLARNALESGATRVAITATCAVDSVVVKIDDNGPGIPADMIEGGYRPFRRSAKGGTGLGLYIATTLLEASGGNVRLESSSSSGTCWCIRLRPMSHQQATAA